jgi:hypothetical protein
MAQFSTEKNALLNNNDTLYEVVMVGGQSGPSIYVPSGNLNTSSDAFGRMRVATPHTVFDSSFRYADNLRKWTQKIAGTGTSTFSSTEGLVNIAIGTTSGDQVVRETNRAFAYQPGKSLMVMNTFTMATPKANLRQRVGYFGKYNGVYLEQDGLNTYIAKRSNVTGVVENSRVSQDDWNVDRLDGTGPSGIVLSVNKSQIFWTDIEWLGVGSVRTGFVVNGQFIVAHIFHHANAITGAYITTASLPCRYEITNTGTTVSGSTLKQICSTVISEGGYTLHNTTRSASNPITGKNLTNAILNPMISIRLRSNHTDAIAIPATIDFYGLQATAFKYTILRKVTSLTNASWFLQDSAGSVEYDISATGLTGGEIIKEGLFKGQDTVPTIILTEIFNSSLQLTREIIENDSAGNIFTVAITPTTNNDDAIASLTWQEFNL